MNPQIDILQAVIQSHKQTVKAYQARNRQKVYQIIMTAILLIEFILLRVLGA